MRAVSRLSRERIHLSHGERQLSTRTMKEIQARFPEDDRDQNPENTTAAHPFSAWKYRVVSKVATTEPGVKEGWDQSW